MKWARRFVSLGVTGGLALGAGACIVSGSNVTAPTAVTTCTVTTDQVNTFQGRWATLPIPLALAQGQFSASETSAIAQAADAWNTYFAKVSPSIPKVFDYGSDGFRQTPGTISTSTPLCSQGILQAGKYTGNVILLKTGKWPASNGGAGVIAVTHECPAVKAITSKFYMAYLEFNYQNFFVSGTTLPDLQSITMHELGHLLGLGHSCEGTGATGIPSCNASIDASYRLASMYPSFSFTATGIGEVRQTLGTNDQGRGACLYGPTAK